MAYFEQFSQVDGQVLFTGSTSSSGPGAAIDTSTFSNIVIQIECEGILALQIEGSNDQVDWFSILTNPLSDIIPIDTILSEGGYQFKSNFKYIRYNVLDTVGDTIEFVIIGRSDSGPSAADNLALAFNPDTPLHVNFGVGVNKDALGGLILSDGIPFYLLPSRTYIFNVNGYSSILLHLSGAMTATCTQSIDGTYYAACYFGLTSGTTLSTTPNAAGIWVGPVVGQFLRVIISGAVAGPVQCSIVLKRESLSGNYWNTGISPTNIAQVGGTAVTNIPINTVQIGGTNVVTAGVAGLQAVGGNIAAGVAPTANPIPAGGIDVTGLTRRLLTDVTGKQIMNFLSPLSAQTYTTNSLASSPAAPLNTAGFIPATYLQTGAQAVVEAGQFEGQTQLELLAQILLELKILNQQLYELPKQLNDGTVSNDPPDAFRQEPSIFNY